MNYWYEKSNRLLSEYVKTVLILEGFSQTDDVKQPLVTNGMSVLFCRTEKDSVGNENLVHLALFGKAIPSDYWSVTNKTTIIAYFFEPFALACVFNISATKLIKTSIDLCNWNSRKGNELNKQLENAESTSGKIEILDSILIALVEHNRKVCEIIKYATDQIMYNSGTEILPEILIQLNISERTFQRIFKKYVGITPNQYRRICQFQLSFSQLNAQKFNKLTDVAYDNGFADQSHFIRSFREFLQITPNYYLKSGLKEK